MSFDANMRHLPAGHEFFAKVWECGKDTKLYSLGVRQGDILRCDMIEDDPLSGVIFHIDGDTYIQGPDDDFYDIWLVYEGNTDGTGFLSDECRDEAMAELR